MPHRKADHLPFQELVLGECSSGHLWWVDPTKKDGYSRCWERVIRDGREVKCNGRVWVVEEGLVRG